MKKITLLILTLASLTIGQVTYAMEFDKPIITTILINKPNAHFQTSSSPKRKNITLMNIKLTPQQRQMLKKQINQNSNNDSNNTLESNSKDLPHQYDRGMNGTPVLDQGAHGTCATFATTAAIDALLGKGDYISQLCNLELGSYFEEEGYLSSGWDGATGPMILNQIMGFGIINKNNQRTKACGGLKEYPADNGNNVGTAMSLNEYKQSSENLNESLDWEPLLTFSQRMEWGDGTKAANALLDSVKKLAASKFLGSDLRITLGVMLPVNYCSAGACARYHANDDTWALTKAIREDYFTELAGHAMIITGYDDDAVAIDNEGNKHQGLLILRNSWGADAGDSGNYYMTYDYFKAFVTEVQKITIDKY